MNRVVLQACVPWLALLGVSFLAAYLLVRLSGSRLRLGRLRRLHRDQQGGVQTLSFVLTLPFFVMVMLLIVQVSQLMIATVVVHYSAYAAARSAIVWIPAALSPDEGANCISTYALDDDPRVPDQAAPVLDPDSPAYGPSGGGLTYIVAPGSPKYSKIASAAVMAVMPICPSRDLGIGLAADPALSPGLIRAAYAGLVPGAANNTRIGPRLDNKLAYAAANTKVEVRFFHRNSEPPLLTYFIPYDITEFRHNEIGWQDTITVTVSHDLALLPGPGRFLASLTPGNGGGVERIFHNGTVYVYPLVARATLGNEGEKPVVAYDYQGF